MQQLDLSTAEDKILADIKCYISEVQAIVHSPISIVESGIRALVELRKTSYEDLNQIQHQYAAFCAVRWLLAQGKRPKMLVGIGIHVKRVMLLSLTFARY